MKKSACIGLLEKWRYYFAGTKLALTFQDTLLLLQILLTDRDERRRRPEYFSFKTLLAWS